MSPQSLVDIPAPDKEANLPPRIHLRCDVCEEPFSVKRSHFLKQEGKVHCSIKCSRIAASEGKWVSLYCTGCRERFKRRLCDFKRNKNGHYFHDRDCYLNWIAEQRIPDDEYARVRNDRRYERYHSDLEYRAQTRKLARESMSKHRRNRILGQNESTERKSCTVSVNGGEPS